MTNRKEAKVIKLNNKNVFGLKKSVQTVVGEISDDEKLPTRTSSIDKDNERKKVAFTRNGVQNSLRKQLPPKRKSNKARQPVDRKTLNIPIFLPTSIQDLNSLSFVNSLFNPNRARSPAKKRSRPKPIL